jgi:hypothetical protein
MDSLDEIQTVNDEKYETDLHHAPGPRFLVTPILIK